MVLQTRYSVSTHNGKRHKWNTRISEYTLKHLLRKRVVRIRKESIHYFCRDLYGAFKVRIGNKFSFFNIRVGSDSH